MPTAVSTGVTAIVPSTQYGMYLLPAFQSGQVGPAVYRRWIRAVARRHEQVRDRLTEQMRKWAGSDPDRQLQIADSLGVVGTDVASARGQPSLAAVVRRLRECSAVWEAVLAVSPPSDWPMLCKLSYCVDVLDAGLPRNGRTLVVTVFDPAENKVLEATAGLARRIGLADPDCGLAACGMYPFGRVIPTVDGRYVDPYQGVAAHEFVDPSGRLFTDSELVDLLYPKPAAVPRCA